MKKCRVCNETKPLELFNKGSGKDGRGSYCKPCASSMARENYARNREARREQVRQARLADPDKYRQRNAAWRKANPDKMRALDVRRYGLTKEQYESMVEDQGNLCAACGNPPSRKHLDVDHDHETGEVRGLLCNRCNLMLGKAKDDVGVLRSLIGYLEKQ